MVWGLRRPRGSGDYMPLATDLVEKDRLVSQHFQSLSAGERAEYDNSVEIFHYEMLAKYKRNGARLPKYLRASFVKLNRRYTNLASTVIARGDFLVSEELKNIIESLEGSIHQFWPMEVIMPNEESYPMRYFGFRICNYVDSFRPKLSSDGSFAGGGTSYTASSSSAEAKGVVFDKSVVDGLHVWREEKLIFPHFYFSDELMNAVKDARLRVFKSFHFECQPGV